MEVATGKEKAIIYIQNGAESMLLEENEKHTEVDLNYDNVRNSGLLE